MYENITTLPFQCGRLEEALGILRDHIVPELKRQSGLLSLCLLPDRANGRLTIISVWTNKLSACAVEAVCTYRNQVKKLDPLLANPEISYSRERLAHLMPCGPIILN